jgi:hypothetical protein
MCPNQQSIVIYTCTYNEHKNLQFITLIDGLCAEVLSEIINKCHSTTNPLNKNARILPLAPKNSKTMIFTSKDTNFNI